MRMTVLVLVLVALGGCAMQGAEIDTFAVTIGCPMGEQSVFGPTGYPVCSPAPLWPPTQTGSRETPTGCALRDGAYHVTWQSDAVDDVRPAFSATKVLAIAGDAMTLDDYRYNLNWTDAATADAWQPGDTGTWEFWVGLDCQSGELAGSRTLTVPYYSPGHQTQTWTLTGTP